MFEIMLFTIGVIIVVQNKSLTIEGIMKTRVMILLLLVSNIFLSQGFYNSKILEDPGVAYKAKFGESVSISGNHLAIGAGFYWDDTACVSIYTKSSEGWGFVKTIKEEEIKQLVPPHCVSLKNDLLLINSQSLETGLPGKAFLYSKDEGGENNWGQIKEFTPPNNEISSFAKDAAMDGNYIVIESYYTSTGVHELNLYCRDEGGTDNWGFVKPITVHAYISFLEICGENLLVGDGYKAFLYSKNEGGENNWGLKKTFENAGVSFRYDAAMNDEYIALSETFDAVWIHGKNTGGDNNWGFIKKIENSVSVGYSQFGYSLALSGDTLVVSDPANDGNGKDLGSVYVFSKDTGGDNNWGLLQHLLASYGGESFGKAVDIDNDKIIIGQPDRPLPFVAERGVVHIFEPAINTIPYFINPLYNIEMNEGEEIIHKYEGYDPDGDECFVSMITPPLGDMTFSDEGVLTFKPTADEIGEHKVIIALTDNNDGTIYDTTNFTVFDISHFLGFEETKVLYNIDYTGFSVSGDYAVIGNMLNLQIHERNNGGENNWGQVNQISNPYPQSYSDFGSNAVIENENVFVIATNGAKASLYIFNRETGGENNWGLHKTISFSADTTVRRFSVSGNQLVVLVNCTTPESRFLNIYEKDLGGEGNWGLQATIFPPNWSEGFAYDVFMSGNDILVKNRDAGEFMIFSKNFKTGNTWEYIATLNVDVPVEGISISFKNGICAIGNQHDGNDFTYQGAVYVFQKNFGGINNWGLVKKIISPNPDHYDYFGRDVEVCGSYILAYGPFFYEGRKIPRGINVFAQNEGGENNWGQIATVTSPHSLLQGYGNMFSFADNNLIARSTYDQVLFFRLPGVVNVEPESEPVNDFNLSQNYPNPFNPSTNIDYSIKSSTNVRLKVYNMLGEEVVTLVNEIQNAGHYSIEFKSNGLPSGVYFYSLQAEGKVLTKKMLLLK